MIIAHFFVGAYIKIADPSATGSATSGAIAAAAFIYIYVVSFMWSYAAIPWIVPAEILPLVCKRIRDDS
jgi:hypothetical protein